jgi:Flp pilus assembly protein TadG
MVEFALVVGVVLIPLIFGVIEGGRMLAAYQGVVTASREGARQGTLYEKHSDCGAIRAAALARSGASGINSADVAVSWDKGPNTPAAPGCPPTTVNYGDRVIVTVSRPFTPLIPVFGTITMSATDRRSITVPPP